MKKSTITLAVGAVLLAIGTTAVAMPNHNVASATITSIGCVGSGAFCWIDIDKSVTVPGCATQHYEIRFDASTSTGKNTHAMLHAAFLANKKVNLQISSCFDGTYPGISHFTVK